MGPGRLKLSLILGTILVIIGGFFVFQQQASAAVNPEINFQGKVVNSDGTNVANNSYNFLFCIYTTASPSSPCTAGSNNDAIWRESKSVTVTDGIFQTDLGDTTAFAGLVDFNVSGLYLGINFNSNGQMSPLVRFTASPYAMNSAKSNNLVGGNNTTLLGALPYQSNTDTTTLLAPNTSTTKNFLTMTGTGTNGAAPSWGTITQADVSGLTTSSSPTFAGMTLNGTLALGANNITSTGSIGTTGSRLTAGFFTDLTVTNAISGSVTGNAGTATTLQNSRNIQGVAFNGSANIDIINGTGFVKATGTTLSYDNSTYLTTTGNGGSLTGLTATQVGLGNVTNDAQLVASTSSTQNGYFGDLYLYDDGTPSNYLQITNSGNLTGAHVLNLNTNNVDRTISLSGDLTVSSAATISGTNTGDQNIFQNFAVSGQSDVVADTATDTVTLIAGTNVSITTNATNDEITINATGGGAGPWTDSGPGTLAYLTTTTEDFAVGGNSLAASLSVDVSLNTVRIGSGSTNDGILNMYANGGATGSLQYTTNDSWYFNGGNVGIGTNDPASLMDVSSSTAHPVLTLSALDNSAYDPQIKFRTDGTPTVKFSMGVDAGDADKFKIYSGDGIGDTSEFSIDTNGVTTIANLQMGAQTFTDDSGIVSWIDMGVTGSPTNGTVESYTALLDGNPMLTIYGTADGSGGTSNRSVRVDEMLGFQETAANGDTYYTFFQGGNQSANLTYTWPGSYPASNNYVLTAQTDGTLSWAAGGPFTDGTGITYLTDTAEDFAIGGNILNSSFSVDVSLARVNIGNSAAFDPITITPAAIGAGSFTGNLTSADLTGNQTWTLQDNSGVIPLGTAGNTLFFTTSGATNATLPSGTVTLAADNQTMYIGTTAVAINRSSAVQSLTGITSIDGSAATLTTARNIQGVSFNGSANIDIINGTGFVKATGTTLSYDNSTYLTTTGNGGSLTGLTATQVGLGNVTNNAQLITGNSAQNGYFGNIYLDDTDASNHLILDYGSNVASDFTLGILMTASRNLTLAGDASISGTNTGDQFTNTTASVLLGRGSAGGAGAAQEITLGTNLTMSGTVLNATGGGMTNPMSAAGDLIYGGSSGTPTRLAGSASDGYVLKYNTATNVPYWSTDLQGGGGGAWTDGTGITYITDTAEDLAIGGSTLASPFSVDVSTNTTRIGSGSGSNGKIDMYASDGDTGSITYTTNDSFALEGGNVGIGTQNAQSALQVGDSTNRGDVSVYGDITAEGYDIQRSLAGIIDIFVYDTSRDSDGGEWRNSTISQQMSWATETKDDGPGDACSISGDDRCGKAVFPRKAILATTADALYIFDGSDNSLWMKFTQAGTYALGADTNNNPSGVGAQNGVIVVGTNGTAGSGMYTFDFKQDAMYRYNATNRVMADKNIGNRNTVVTYATNPETNFAILDPIVNDVSIAMQNASNEGAAGTIIAPIDSQAGPVRGVTIVAAATDTGLSVVHMGPRKVFNYSDATGNDYNQVVMTSRGRMYATNEALGQLEEWRNIDKDFVSEVNGTPDRVYDETVGKSPITTGTVPVISTSPSALAVIERGSSARESSAAGQADSGDIVFVGTNQGLAEVHTSGGLLPAASWSKLTTTTVATPYMNGAVRSAHLFDEAVGSTSSTSAVGVTTTKNVLSSAVTGTPPTFGQPGVRGNSINFNNNSYLCSDADANGVCDADTDFNVAATSFTVSMWFKHSVTAAADTLFERCYTPATPTAAVGCVYAGMHTTGQIRFALDTATTWTYNTTYDYNLLSTASYNDNQWHHAVFTNTDTDICLYIDGRQAVACITSIGTASADASQVLTVGGTCAGANCVTGANFWDGSIDDFTWDSNAGTTAGGLTAQSANKMYLDGRAHLIRPSASVADATTFSSTTIGDSGEAYVPGSYVGLVVELTGGMGAGQTRTIIANDATTFTVYPAFATTPDATTDYQVSPAKLYGSTNNVTAISADLPTSLNKVRKVYVGTNDGSDGGGISVFTNAGAGSIRTDVIHSDSGYSNDDLGSSWSGTDADDINALASYSDTIAMGTGSFLRAQRKEVSLKQLQLDTIGSIEDIRQELVGQGLFGSTQDVLGLGQGADLAEYYNSNQLLEAGTIVSTAEGAPEMIEKSSTAYQKNVLGVVATKPAITMGSRNENSYPVALSGRVPVNVVTENGYPMKGDQITTSSLAGYGMVAIETGRVIGTVLENSNPDAFRECPADSALPTGTKCGQVMVFVNLTDFTGVAMEDLMTKKSYDTALTNPDFAKLLGTMTGEEMLDSENSPVIRSEWQDIFKATSTLGFLQKMKDPANGITLNSEILAKNVNAAGSVVSPLIVTDTLVAKKIKAESIEGLEFIQLGMKEAQEGAEGAAAGVSNLGTELGAMKKQLQGLTTSSGTAIELGLFKNLENQGSLKIGGEAEFKGPAIFRAVAQFVDKVIFKKDVEFAGTATFNSDTAGYAVIHEGQDRVKIAFDQEYAISPVINASLSLQSIRDEEERKAAEDLLLISDVKFIITNVTTKGLEIRIDQKALSDIPFVWSAIAVKDAKTFESKEEKDEAPIVLTSENEEEVQPQVTDEVIETENNEDSESGSVASVTTETVTPIETTGVVD